MSFELVDDGQGLRADWTRRARATTACAWLRERVESLGGEFALEPILPRGVRLRAQLNAQPMAGDHDIATPGVRATT